MVINILNIPNYYSSYYLLGLSQNFKIKFKQEERFVKYNNRPIIIFTIDNRLGVIDNDDPGSVVDELYDLCTLYFVTNKLLNSESYNRVNVIPLFPHYPVNILLLYLRFFGLSLFRFLKLKDIIREMYIYARRPYYKNQENGKVKADFVFFSARIWKKEVEANRIRAEFIKFCKSESRIKFEGGFVSRSDGVNIGFESEINERQYSARMFSKLSARSTVVLNNPAVCDAVSWRLAEYLNHGLFVLSFPFKIELPEDFVNQENIHFIDSPDEYKAVFDIILESPDYHKKVSKNGKKYFESFCTPQKQVQYIINSILEV